MIRRLIGAAGFSAALMVLVLWTAGTAVAVTLTLPLRDTGRQFPANSGVVVHRVSLAIPGLTEILRIDLLDLGTGTSSAPGVFSGFDLDAVFLDIDGDLATTSDRYLATGYIFSGGYVRPAPRGPLAHYYNPSPRRPGPLFGSNTKTSINHGLASLGRLDATNIADVNAALGFLSLGEWGRLTLLFDPGVPVGATLWLIAGEVGGNGESLAARIAVPDPPPPPPPPPAAVPGPAALPLLGSALALLAVFGSLRRRRLHSTSARP